MTTTAGRRGLPAAPVRRAGRATAALVALFLLLLGLMFPAGAEAQALPEAQRSAYRVVVDAGHGGADPGAMSTVAPLVEKEAVLKLARLTGAALQRRGIGVVYTRTDDRYVPLAERAALPAQSGASLLISLHLNAAANPGVSGAEGWYGQAERSADLAGAVLAGMSSAGRDYGVTLRGTRPGSSLAVLRTGVPATLIEVGYVSNPREASLLTQSAFLERVAEGVATGVARFRDGTAGPAPATTGTPRATPALTAMTDLYFIRQGDTLQAIASRFRSAGEEIVRLNPPQTTQRMLPGDPLLVPAGESAVASWSTTAGAPPAAARTPGAETHTVQVGETLSGIALRYGVNGTDLARWNEIADARRLLVGQRLRLRPGAATSPATSSATSPAEVSAAGAAPAGRAAVGAAVGAPSRRYRVQPGDTLSQIAQRNGVTLGALLAANPLSDPNHVLVGTSLVIPAGARA